MLRGLLDKPGFRGRGLLGRFLYAMPESLLGRRNPEAPPVPVAVRAAYQARVRGLLALRAAEDAAGEPEPRVLRLGPEAAGRLNAFAREVEPKLAPFGELGAMTDWGGKLVGLVARLAGLLHAAVTAGDSEDCGNSGTCAPWATLVSGPTMAHAIRLGRYAVPHARAAYAEMGADPTVEGARHVLAWIEKTGVPRFTKRDAYQGTKGRFKTVDALEPALTLLVEHGYVRPVPPPERPGVAGRKPSPIYDVNPLTPNSQYSHISRAGLDSENHGNCGNGDEAAEPPEPGSYDGPESEAWPPPGDDPRDPEPGDDAPEGAWGQWRGRCLAREAAAGARAPG